MAIAATTVLLAGCGGGVTRQQVIARGNAICFRSLEAIRAVPPPTGPATRSLGIYLNKLAPIVEREANEVRKLPRPAADRAVLDAWIASIGAVAANYRTLVAAARTGNQSAISAAESALGRIPAEQLARRYGLGECAASEGTTVAR